MDRAHVFFVVLLNLFSVQLTFCESEEPVMFLTPSNYEMRSIGAQQPFIQAQYHPASGTIQQGIMLPQEHLMPQERIPEELYYQERMMPQGSMLHQERLLPPEHIMPQENMQLERLVPQGNVMPQQLQGRTVTQERTVPQNVQNIVHTGLLHSRTPPKQEGQTTEQDRAVKGGYEYQHPPTYPQTPSYGYGSSSPSYNTPASPTPSYSAPTVHSDPATKFLIKPDLTELIKPVTGKMAGKLNGLTGLVLSLLGSGKGLELSGIKDLLIDGILKPLLVAKGGIKALISKLAIPVVALILINVEVLITVWWLWEDCPAVKHEVEYTKPSYPAAGPAATSNYNYR